MLTRYGDHFHFLPHPVRVRHDLSNIHRLHDAAVVVLRNVLCFGDRRKRVRQHMTSDCAATPTRHVNDRYWVRRVNGLMIVMAASTFWSHLCPVTFSRSFFNKPEPGVCASGLIPLEGTNGAVADHPFVSRRYALRLGLNSGNDGAEIPGEFVRTLTIDTRAAVVDGEYLRHYPLTMDPGLC